MFNLKDMIMDYCMICGAQLSENNTTGIGYECMAALNAAKKYKAKCEGIELKVYIKRASLVKEKFISVFEKVKFRSEFKKSFFVSISNSEKVSKKQLLIMENEITAKIGDDFIRNLNNKMEKYRDYIIEHTNVTREEIEKARSFIRKKN